MKKYLLLLFTSAIPARLLLTIMLAGGCLLTSYLSFSQAPPQGINYQAVARDASGNPLVSTAVSVDFIIHQNTSGGATVYSENQNTTTNQFGLFTLVIGTVTPATFATIPWGTDKFFLEVKVNGNNMGTTQFMAVPYAMHSSTSGNGLPSGTSGQTLRHDGTNWIGNNTIYNDGTNVGIGTILPSAKLHVSKSTLGGEAGRFEITNAADPSAALAVTTIGTGYGGYFMNENGPSALVGYTNGTSGNAGVFEILNAGNTQTALIARTPGTGSAGHFEITNAASGADALSVTTNGTGIAIRGINTSVAGNAYAVYGENTSSSGIAILGTANSAVGFTYGVYGTSVSPNGIGVYGTTIGNGTAIEGFTFGTGNAGKFIISNTTSSADALSVFTSGTGRAGNFQIGNAGSGVDALYATTNGIGSALRGDATGIGNGIFGSSNGSGSAVFGSASGTGNAGNFQINNIANNQPALYATTNGTGLAGEFVGKLKTTNFQMTNGAVAGNILTSDASGNASWVAGSSGTVTAVTGSGNIASSGGATPNITFTGILPLASGGTNANLTALNGGIVWSNGTQFQISAAGTSGQLLASNGAAAPSWTNAPATITASNGLTKTGNDIQLGGTLSAATTIANGGFDLNITGIGNVGIGVLPSGSYKVEVNGKLKSTGLNETSDMRYKKNISTIDNALNKVIALRGVNYEWRTDEFKEKNFDTAPQIGLIAQEVEKIIPQVVATDASGYKSVEYSKLVALLIEAVKEQQKKIDALTAENKDLKNNSSVTAEELKALKADVKTLHDAIDILLKESVSQKEGKK